jgi:hypothetical protein
MKKKILITCLLLIILNSILGLIYSNYRVFNWLIIDFLIFLNSFFLLFLQISKTKEGNKVSLSFIIPIIGSIEILLSIFMDNNLLNNNLLSICLFLVTIQILLIIFTYFLKQNNK